MTGAIYLPYLVPHRTAWSKHNGMNGNSLETRRRVCASLLWEIHCQIEKKAGPPSLANSPYFHQSFWTLDLYVRMHSFI